MDRQEGGLRPPRLGRRTPVGSGGRWRGVDRGVAAAPGRHARRRRHGPRSNAARSATCCAETGARLARRGDLDRRGPHDRRGPGRRPRRQARRGRTAAARACPRPATCAALRRATPTSATSRSPTAPTPATTTASTSRQTYDGTHRPHGRARPTSPPRPSPPPSTPTATHRATATRAPPRNATPPRSSRACEVALAHLGDVGKAAAHVSLVVDWKTLTEGEPGRIDGEFTGPIHPQDIERLALRQHDQSHRHRPRLAAHRPRPGPPHPTAAHSGERSSPATRAVASPAATDPPAGAKPTTSGPGIPTDAPTATTSSCSATTTTTSSTDPAGPSSSTVTSCGCSAPTRPS